MLAPGTTFTLGGEDAFRLEDASPPVASARLVRSGQLRTAVEGLLVLPDEDRPEVSIFEDASGRWVAEDGLGTRPVADRDIVVADGEVLDARPPQRGRRHAGRSATCSPRSTPSPCASRWTAPRSTSR